MVIELLVAEIGPVISNFSVNAPAVPVIERSVNVATPLTGVTEVVPRNVPVPEAIDATTDAVDEVTVLPCESRIVT
jgi:hypothetical protein